MEEENYRDPCTCNGIRLPGNTRPDFALEERP